MEKIALYIIFLAIGSFGFVACKKDDPKPATNTNNNTGEVNTYSNVMLYAKDTSGGNFYDVIGNHVYDSLAATGHPGEIDFIYNYTGTEATIFSAADTTLFKNEYPGTYKGWPAKVKVQFGLLTNVTSSQFDSLNTSAAIDAKAGIVSTTGGSIDKHIGGLSVGDIFGFWVEEKGKYGIVRITDLKTGTKGYIKFDVKLQK